MLDKRVNPRLLGSEPLRRCELGECKAACCLHGVWVDLMEVKDILSHSASIIPHMPEGLENPAEWFELTEEEDDHSLSRKVRHSLVLPKEDHYGGTACVFLRSDYKCALQVAADLSGMHSWRFKPFYCILQPLDLDEAGRITLDVKEELVDEPASCLRPAEKPVMLAVTFEPELRYLLGEKLYGELLQRTRDYS